MIEEIKYLPSFQQELDAIVDYISFTLEAPRAALNLVDELEISINKLKQFPNTHRAISAD
ncbi:MAG: type II toxin-antitoxin system RelE/ParE family toxin [Treponema sp.]|jgi:plasmid stabilization system protein ParE|nr:type II toxin-antitoxin system RelE/ParE family toxin [Treponema sp.]